MNKKIAALICVATVALIVLAVVGRHIAVAQNKQRGGETENAAG